MKALDSAVFLALITGWLLFVNSLDFEVSTKYILYLLTFILLGAWVLRIITSPVRDVY